VIAPNVVRPHSDYVAAVALHGGSSKTDEAVTVEIKDDQGTYQKTKTVTISLGVSTIARITVSGNISENLSAVKHCWPSPWQMSLAGEVCLVTGCGIATLSPSPELCT
jgi:hypothetical protein